MMRAVLLPARWIGRAVIYGLVGAWAVLWFAAEPPGQPAVAYLGQFFGAESVLLLSIGMVLISTLPCARPPSTASTGPPSGTGV